MPPYCLFKGPRVETHPDPVLPRQGPFVHVVCLLSPRHAGPHLCFSPCQFRVEFPPDGSAAVRIQNAAPCWIVAADGTPKAKGTLRHHPTGAPLVVFGPEDT